jgi:cyclophilin family peptidyl-prolyl cis-trans isomerase
MSVTIHTTAGDLKCEIYCDTCPRTAFNFLALAAAGKYNGTIFHRNIRGFMMQGGDTAHVTGKKSSIWGDDVTFPDEFHPNNKHDRRGRLSMANRGPNTNKVSLIRYGTAILAQKYRLDVQFVLFVRIRSSCNDCRNLKILYLFCNSSSS